MCPKQNSDPRTKVMDSVQLTQSPAPGNIPTMILLADWTPDRETDVKTLIKGKWWWCSTPIPSGYAPVLLLLAPEDAAMTTPPSAVDILSSILGSLLPDLADSNAVLGRYQLAHYQGVGNSPSPNPTKGSTAPG